MDRNDEFNFTVIDDNGNEVICDVISLLQDKNNGEIFILYTDYTLDSNNRFNTYLSQLIEKQGEYELKGIDNREKYNYLLENAHSVYGKSLEELMAK